MLTRGKPLAHFVDDYPAESDEEIIPEDAFESYVQSRKFVKREFVELRRRLPTKGYPHIRGTRHVFYARPGEAWRIDAFIMMLAFAAEAGWSEGFERLEGNLLGYEDWQTDVHLDRIRSSPHVKNFPWLRRPESD